MGEYQEWAVQFQCKKEKVKELIGLVEDTGVEVSEENNLTDVRDGDTVTDMVEVTVCDAGTASYVLYEGLARLKKRLVEKGAVDVSVMHAWAPELEEVEVHRGE